MRILGSGTPRLKRDLGYGYCPSLSVVCSLSSSLSGSLAARPNSVIFALQVLQRFSSVCGGRQNISYLVLAVAVTSRGTAGHFDGISEGRWWLVGKVEGVSSDEVHKAEPEGEFGLAPY